MDRCVDGEAATLHEKPLVLLADISPSRLIPHPLAEVAVSDILSPARLDHTANAVALHSLRALAHNSPQAASPPAPNSILVHHKSPPQSPLSSNPDKEDMTDGRQPHRSMSPHWIDRDESQGTAANAVPLGQKRQVSKPTHMTQCDTAQECVHTTNHTDSTISVLYRSCTSPRASRRSTTATLHRAPSRGAVANPLSCDDDDGDSRRCAPPQWSSMGDRIDEATGTTYGGDVGASRIGAMSSASVSVASDADGVEDPPLDFYSHSGRWSSWEYDSSSNVSRAPSRGATCATATPQSQYSTCGSPECPHAAAVLHGDLRSTTQSNHAQMLLRLAHISATSLFPSSPRPSEDSTPVSCEVLRSS